MGIYIKGMEMPTSCMACLYSRTDIRNVDWCVLTEKDLPCDCPLVPVQPHGRLIIEDGEIIAEDYRKAMTDEHNRAANLAWEKEHCWIPVTERLPKEGEFVLVYGDLYPNKHDGGVIAVSKRMDWNYWQGFGRERDITHWMPLPQPPKEESYGV